MNKTLPWILSLIFLLALGGESYYLFQLQQKVGSVNQVTSTASTQNLAVKTAQTQAVTTAAGSAVVGEASPKNSCPKASIKENDITGADGSVNAVKFVLTLDGKEIPATEVSNIDGQLAESKMSYDCKTVAWSYVSHDELDSASGKYIHSDKIRVMDLQTQKISEFAAPEAGPVAFDPYTGSTLVVGIHSPTIFEGDFPGIGQLQANYYSLDISTGKSNALGGPYLAVSSDLQQAVVYDKSSNFVLENLNSKKPFPLTTQAAKEYATEFAFSPDGKNLAFLLLTGDEGDIQGVLSRFSDSTVIVNAKLLVMSAADGSTKRVISGGYSSDSAFDVDTWLNNTTVQYTEPEIVQHPYPVNITTLKS